MADDDRQWKPTGKRPAEATSFPSTAQHTQMETIWRAQQTQLLEATFKANPNMGLREASDRLHTAIAPKLGTMCAQMWQIDDMANVDLLAMDEAGRTTHIASRRQLQENFGNARLEVERTIYAQGRELVAALMRQTATAIPNETVRAEAAEKLAGSVIGRTMGGTLKALEQVGGLNIRIHKDSFANSPDRFQKY